MAAQETPHETRMVSKFLRDRPDDSWQFSVAREHNDAYGTLQKAFSMDPDAIVEDVKASGLRGKGGAGFGTGQKWSLVPKDVFPRYLAVNADEGEPCTFKDHMLVERDPHQIIEGAIVTAYAIRRIMHSSTCAVNSRSAPSGSARRSRTLTRTASSARTSSDRASTSIS